jgi:hypothetical protein
MNYTKLVGTPFPMDKLDTFTADELLMLSFCCATKEEELPVIQARLRELKQAA